MTSSKRPPRLLLVATLATGVGLGGVAAGFDQSDQADQALAVTPLLDEDAIAELQLDPRQFAELARVQSQSGRVVETVRDELAELRGRLDQELASDEPNLRLVFEQGVDERRQAIIDAIDEARELRLGFYDTLNPAQKRQVAERIEQRLRRFDRMRSVIGRLLLNQSIL